MPDRTHTGWLLDVYADPAGGLALWLLDEDGTRRCLRQEFPVTFYVAGFPARLRLLWRFLMSLPIPLLLERTERRDLFQAEPLTVLAVQVTRPADQPGLFSRLSRDFPDLTYYDADLSLALRHAARFDTFPLAHCCIETDGNGKALAIQVLDSPWDLDPPMPPLRILSLEPDVDPAHAAPTHIWVRERRASYHLALEPVRPFLVNLAAILRRHDPDLLLTTWGDTWLLPRLLEMEQRTGLELPLNRDPACRPAHKPERSYFAYGQVIHRGRQVHLFGRWHVDGYNAVFYHDYGLEGVFELARVTALPVQTVARVSPGTGISSMQILTALREGVLVPWHKQQAEQPKTALELLRTDQGGLVYQPTVGLHYDVAEIDFISMYPSIMAHFNISPETVKKGRNLMLASTNGGKQPISEPDGLVPKTLRPLLEKRIALKMRNAHLPAWDPRRKSDKARATAHKWLLVTCFGYLGYKNARFGRIEAHEAVTARGREALLQAKEVAEDLGFSVLHMYVDGLWVKKDGAKDPADFQEMLNEIASRTGLPVALDGVYRWVAFLPSRVDARIPVPNRYFGAFQDGSLKMRGIEARRGDTPAWIVEVQLAMLERMSQAVSPEELRSCLPDLQRILQSALATLRRGCVPLVKLVASQRLSRELHAYRTPSPAARAAAQLAGVGVHLRPGQRVRFLYTLGDSGVRAWDLPGHFNPRAIDVRRYRSLLLRAAQTVAGPLGVSQSVLTSQPVTQEFFKAPDGLVVRQPGVSRRAGSLSGSEMAAR